MSGGVFLSSCVWLSGYFVFKWASSSLLDTWNVMLFSFVNRTFNKSELIIFCQTQRYYALHSFARHSFRYISMRLILSLPFIELILHCFLKSILSLTKHWISCCLLDFDNVVILFSSRSLAPKLPCTHQSGQPSSPASSLLFLEVLQGYNKHLHWLFFCRTISYVGCILDIFFTR